RTGTTRGTATGRRRPTTPAKCSPSTTTCARPPDCPATDAPLLDRPERHPYRSVVRTDFVQHRRVHHLDVAAHEHVVDLAVRSVRWPRPPSDRAAPTRKQRAHRRAPQVEVADDHSALVRRRAP